MLLIENENENSCVNWDPRISLEKKEENFKGKKIARCL